MSEIIKDNPFSSVGSIISKSSFVGRNYELDTIKGRLFGSNFGNLAIVGIPKIGKSSLMNYALVDNAEKLWNEKRFIVTWYTFKQRESTMHSSKDVFIRLVGEINHFLKKHREIELLEELQDYTEVVLSADSVWSEFEQNLLYYFEEIVYAGIRVIFCIDEFDYSKDYLSEIEYELLRELSYRNSNKIAIVTTSRRSIYDIEHYSGGGSNFYGTFENIYLKPFTEPEHTSLCSLVDGLTNEECDKLFITHGGHPYISAIVLNQYFRCNDFPGALLKVNQDVLQYYQDLFYVLGKDDLADKVDRLYCGYFEGVSEAQEDYIYNCYGIFVEDKDGYMIPYCKSFETILSHRYRENPFSLTWPEAESSIRKAITYALTQEYGDENISRWADELADIQEIKACRLNKWRDQMQKEQWLFKHKASINIVDQLYPIDYPVFFEIFWVRHLKEIFSTYTLSTWVDNLTFIANKVRNPEMHSRRNLLSNEDKNRAAIICKEIIECTKRFGL